MSRPLFAVGEDVWLVSRYLPEVNGPTQVLEVKKHGTCSTPSCQRDYAYFLGIPSNSRKGTWCESALRKRPKAGDSFESIMDALKEKIPA